MGTFPAVETYRTELRATPFTPMTDAELAEARRRNAMAHHSSAMEGIHPTPEQAAFHAMLLDERVPVVLASEYHRRFLHERIVAPALARQGAAAPVAARA